MDTDFKIMVTGHRPDRLGAHSAYAAQVCRYVLGHLKSFVASRGLRLVAVSGMAIGVDMAFAEAAVEYGIPLYACPPGTWQPNKWPAAEVERWKTLMSKAEYVEWPHAPDEYSVHKFFSRNKTMVDGSHVGLAFWDMEKRGGTWDAVRLLIDSDKPFLLVPVACRDTTPRLMQGNDGLPWFGLDRPEDVHSIAIPYMGASA